MSSNHRLCHVHFDLQLGAELRARRIFWPKLAFFDGVGCALHAGTVFTLYLTQITPVSHNFVRNIFPLKACIEWYQNLWTKTGRYWNSDGVFTATE